MWHYSPSTVITMSEQEETTFTATFDHSSQQWTWDKDYDYGPRPGSPVDVLLKKIEANEHIDHNDFFNYLFMLQNMCSSYAREVIVWIINQGDLTTESKLSFAAWKGLYYAYEHEHNKVEWVTQKEYEIVKSMRNAWSKK